MQVGVTAIACLVIDKTGRRALMMFAGIGMSGACVILGAWRDGHVGRCAGVGRRAGRRRGGREAGWKARWLDVEEASLSSPYTNNLPMPRGSFGVAGYFFYLKDHGKNPSGDIALAAVLFYVMFFSSGLGAIPWSAPSVWTR